MQKRKLGEEPSHCDLFLYTHTTNHDLQNFPNTKDRLIYVSKSCIKISIIGHVQLKKLQLTCQMKYLGGIPTKTGHVESPR